MTPQDFCYWFQGFIEIADPKELSEKELQVIKDHLALVFKKETPAYAAGSTITWSDVTKPSPLASGGDLAKVLVTC